MSAEKSGVLKRAMLLRDSPSFCRRLSARSSISRGRCSVLSTSRLAGPDDRAVDAAAGLFGEEKLSADPGDLAGEHGLAVGALADLPRDGLGHGLIGLVHLGERGLNGGSRDYRDEGALREVDAQGIDEGAVEHGVASRAVERHEDDLDGLRTGAVEPPLPTEPACDAKRHGDDRSTGYPIGTTLSRGSGQQRLDDFEPLESLLRCVHFFFKGDPCDGFAGADDHPIRSRLLLLDEGRKAIAAPRDGLDDFRSGAVPGERLASRKMCWVRLLSSTNDSGQSVRRSSSFPTTRSA